MVPSRTVRSLPASAAGARFGSGGADEFLTVTTTVSVSVAAPSETVSVRV